MFNEVRACVLLGALLCACGGGQVSVPATTSVNTAVGNLHAGQVIDGVPCLTSDLPVVHDHVHLVILADGQPVIVPAGIGVGRPWGADATGFIATGSCFAWLHTHDRSGLVHIVSSADRSFTLLNLFDVWGRPLGPGSALGYRGDLAVYVNGRRVEGDPRTVPLANLTNIVLELGRPPSVQPPALYDFASPRA